MKATRYQLVELIKAATIVSAGTKLFFQDQPQLRSLGSRIVQILAIEAYPVEVMPKTPSGNDTSDEAAFKNAVLALNVDGYENLQYIPLPRLSVMQVNTDTVPFTNHLFEFSNLFNVDWTKSYIQFNAAPAGTQFSYLFGVHYKLLPEDNRQPG